MALTQDTILSHWTGVDAAAVLQICLESRVLNDAAVMAFTLHRTSVPYNLTDEQVQMQMDEVNSHLAEMGKAPLAQDAIDRIVMIVAAVRV